MILTHLWVLNFLWFLPLVCFALIVQNRKKKTAMAQFADAALLMRLTAKDHRGIRLLKGILLLFTLALLVFSLAGPRWGSSYQEVSQKGVDVMILVDVSPSMMVEDLKPNRLEQARREIIDFLKVVEGDRVGLVAFAGAAFVQCPLTLDYAALQLFLNALEPGLIPAAGTDLGAAIETGLSAFDFKAETDKVMLLITDGEDNEGRSVEAARIANKRGVKIFVFGIGELSGGPIPQEEGKGGFKKDKEGKLILSKLNENGLKEIAADAGGRYVRSMAGDLDLDIIYFDGIKSMTQARTLKSGKIKIYDERFTFFILAALLLLLTEGFIAEKGKSTAKNLSVFFLIFFITHGASIFSPAFADENPDQLYKQERFAEAESAYAQLDMDHPKDIRYRYNRGCSAYQNKDYKGAMAAFSSVWRRTQNDKDDQEDPIRLKVAFNLGNTAYKLGDYASAVAFYRQILLKDPSNGDARFNMELVLRALEKQKEEQKKKEDMANPEGNQEEKDPEDQRSSGEKKEGEEAKEEKQDKSHKGENENQANEDHKTKEASPNDLKGELKTLRQLPPDEQKDASDNNAASLDRQRAEALLDNIKEDPSRRLQFLLPGEKKHGASSGKDW
jgi:Ca-activated chloride channel homolog